MNILIFVSSFSLKSNSFMIPGGAEKVAWDLANVFSKKQCLY